MGKYERGKKPARKGLPFFAVPVCFLLIEVFGFCFLGFRESLTLQDHWPLAFGLVWALLLSFVIRLLPNKAGRVVFGTVYLLSLVYAGFQTGYYYLFGEMMWLSEFLYASEGADYAGVLLSYPVSWYLSILGLLAAGGYTLRRFPAWKPGLASGLVCSGLALICVLGAFFMPQLVFLRDGGIRYSGSDYGRMQASEAAYNNMFNTHRLYQVCGLYQTGWKDIYANGIYPMTPGYARERKLQTQEIRDYFAEDQDSGANEMTGLLQDKQVVLVLMESMDDWMIGEHTPTISRLMEEGISFENFYTPGYGGIRTFNTEFCINTGSFLSSQGGYAFDYVTNTYSQSLAAQLRQQGYSALTFHYNDPSFYSRGVFSEALGYEDYVCYGDYLGDMDEEAVKQLLYDDQLLFDNAGLKDVFFRDGKRLNFIITRSAHLSYKYNEVLSHWGLKKYPQYRGLTGNEETDCAYLKAKLVDDLFARLLLELEQRGELENTVIIGVTDHYTYGYKDMDSLLALSGVEETLLLEKTPCFIWSAELSPMKVEKTLNTADFLPTVLNILGVESRFDYIGHDAFDPSYEGFVPFPDGSWITSDLAYSAETDQILYLQEDAAAESGMRESMAELVSTFTGINNLILDTDYYKNPS